MSTDQELLAEFGGAESPAFQKAATQTQGLQKQVEEEALLQEFADDGTAPVPEAQKSLIQQVEEAALKQVPIETASGAADVVMGFGKGVITSIEQTANFALDTADYLENLAADYGMGDGKFFDETTQLNVVEKIFQEPKNAAEYAGKMIGQYLAPFGLVNKAIKAKGMVGIASNIAGSAAISGVITDPEEKRLSDLIQGNPLLANPLAEFLASDTDDSRMLSRVKTGIEAAIVDTVTLGGFKLGSKGIEKASSLGEALFRSVRASKQARKTKELEKFKVGNQTPDSASVVDEATLAKQEAKINESVEINSELSAQSGVDGAPLPKASADDLKPKTPKEPALSAKETAALRQAEILETTKAKNIPELVEELRASGREYTADDLWQVAKGGKITDKQSRKMAEEIFKNKEAIKARYARNFRDPLKKEELEALAMEGSVLQLEVDSFIKGVKNVDELSDAELAVFMERIDRMQGFEASVKAGLSEAGRTLRGGMQIPELLQDVGEDAIKSKKIKEYIKLHGGTQGARETLRAVKQIQDSGLSTYDVMSHHSKTIGQNIADSAFEVWVNSVLSGVKTLAVTNPVSNIATQGGFRIENRIAEAYGKLLGRGVVSGEHHAYVEAYKDAFPEALAAAKHMFKTGAHLPQARSKFLLSRKNSISADSYGMDPMSQAGKAIDTIGNVINTPTKILSAQDVFFNTMSQRARTAQIAHRMAVQNGLEVGSSKYTKFVDDIKANPPEAVFQEAERHARELTLMSPLGSEQGIGFGSLKVTGDTIQSLSNTMEKFPFGRYAGAFMRVSTNLSDRALQRTPLSFLRPETRKALAGTSASAQEELAKMTFGTSVLFATGGLAYSGYITGGGPDDPKMKRALKSSGFQEYSIKIPGGGAIPLKEFGPLGVVAQIAADIAELAGRLDADDENSSLVEELIMAGSALMMKSFTPEVLADGIPDFFGFIKEAGEGKITPTQIADSMGRFSKGFMPFSALSRDTLGLMDPEIRDKRPDPDSNVVSKVWQRVRNEWLENVGLDGFAGLPPELNMFGQEVYSPMGVGGSIKSAIFGNDRDPNDLVINEILRLKMTDEAMHVESPNEESLALRMPERVKRKGIGIGQGITIPVKLDPQQYHDYVKLSAGLKVGDLSIGAPPLKDAMKDLISSDQYKEMPDPMKKISIKKMASEYKKAAWQVLQMQGNIQEEMNQKAQKRVKSTFGIPN